VIIFLNFILHVGCFNAQDALVTPLEKYTVSQKSSDTLKIFQ